MGWVKYLSSINFWLYGSLGISFSLSKPNTTKNIYITIICITCEGYVIPMYLNTCVSFMWGVGNRVCILRLRISSMSPPRDETTSVFTPYTCARDKMIGVYRYRISSKSHHGEILFRGPVWCNDNSRVARFRGWLDFVGGVYRDQHACSYTASIISLFVYACIMHVHIRTCT